MIGHFRKYISFQIIILVGISAIMGGCGNSKTIGEKALLIMRYVCEDDIRNFVLNQYQVQAQINYIKSSKPKVLQDKEIEEYVSSHMKSAMYQFNDLRSMVKNRDCNIKLLEVKQGSSPKGDLYHCYLDINGEIVNITLFENGFFYYINKMQ